MRSAARLLLVFPALLLLAPVRPADRVEAAQPAYAHNGSLCAVGEVVIFHCGVGRKMLSVCGDRRPTAHAQYRFGTPGDIELAFPGPDQSGLTWARQGDSGGRALQIRFANRGYDYIAESRAVRTGFRGRNNPRFSDGVIVLRGGRLLANRACTTPARSDGQAEDFMPEGTFLDWQG